ncbi:MAG: hypothetical protein GYB49_15870 [Alphaproteobacteria bacterium]|nr:hypothetical protein [Hyphomonas sp.]MBR9808693.1 hypothetical protein [Alphaproteobacteria bacterium]|tara:strand:+ start:1109 stop:1867 length:759 start_codon:yes stop_codon:yes gene_type:complete
MRICLAAIITAFCLLPACARAETEAPCAPITHLGQSYTVCTFDTDSGIHLWHSGPEGELFGQFDTLASHLAGSGQTLIFAMNGGMYHEDRRPVGLYVEDGKQTAPLVTREGPGNFGMLPNGVFWVDEEGQPRVTESLAYQTLAPQARFATQSGPMLVIDGALHPRFNEDGPSRKRRNGVGVSADGQTVYFAISDVPVNFYSFATLFRDELGTPNALYLDGYVSKLYAPHLGRNETGLDMGPIIGVAAPQKQD